MKRRITALILVVVMLALSLVGCDYSLASDDLSNYASFSNSDKEKFEAFLKTIIIEDGDFSMFDDEETGKKSDEIRAEYVSDAVYAALKNKADTADKLTEGAIGDHDIAYFTYYVTADVSGVTNYFYVSKLKDPTVLNLQLGINDYGFDEDSDPLSGTNDMFEAVALALKGYEFTEDKAYVTDKTSTVKAGDVVFVSCSYSYKSEDDTETKGKYSNHIVTVTDDKDTFAGQLAGQPVGDSKGIEFTVTETRGGKEVSVTYSTVKIDWISKGEKLVEYKETSFDEEKKVTNTLGETVDLKGKELTYHIYPVNYVKVDELTAENLINIIAVSSSSSSFTGISASTMYTLLFGPDYSGLHEDHDGHSHTDEEKDENDKNLAELKEMLKAYVTVEKDEDILEKFEKDIVTKIADLQKDCDTAKKKFDTEDSNLTKKNDDVKTKTDTYETSKKAYEEKQAIVTAAGDKATDAQKKAASDAKAKMDSDKLAMDNAIKARDALTAENGSYTKAKKDYETERDERDAEIKKVLDIAGREKVVANYKTAQYNSLQASYNNEIKMNIAKEVYYYLTKNVAVSGAPEKAIKNAYDEMISNYKYKFYEGTYDSKNSNYKQYNGSFEEYLKATVKKDLDLKEVNSYDDALAAVKTEAESQIKDRVRIYVVAKAYGDVFVTDKEYKEFQKDPQDGYYAYRYGPLYYYGYGSDQGEENARLAYQFDQLLDHILESEEDEAEAADANGFIKIVDKYEKIEFTIGDPLSEAEEETEDEESSEE